MFSLPNLSTSKPLQVFEEGHLKQDKGSLQMKHRLFLSSHSNGAYHNGSDIQVIPVLIYGRGPRLQTVLMDCY